MNRYGFLVALLIASVVGGFGTTTVFSQPQSGTNLSDLETYAWGSKPEKSKGGASTGSDIGDTRIQLAIEKELAAKGYKKESDGQPDFLVAYEATLQEQLDLGAIKRSYRDDPVGLPQGVTSEKAVRENRLASFVLYIMEPESQGLLWQGSEGTVMSLISTTQEREKKIREVVREILDDFPSR